MPWLSTMTTNAGILLAGGLLAACVGFSTLLIVHVPIVVDRRDDGRLASNVQHQFEATSMGRDDGLAPA